MLLELNEQFTEEVSQNLQELSPDDRRFFQPHAFDIKSVEALSKEKGNNYYVYIDDTGSCAGYGMLRTFDTYEIPTLGCVIWVKYRGRGNGKKLVRELLDKAQELHYQRVRLKVHPDNAVAYSLYREAGFLKIGENEDGTVWMEYNGEPNAGIV
jgi:ribosomal protein S18 acetylase RimI-like enzyme